MKKKLIFVLLFALVSTSLLVGCGGVSENDYTLNANGEDVITRESAMKLAAKHLSVKASDLAFTSVKFSNNNNVETYDVSFKHNGAEYNCTIDAKTGKVLELNNGIRIDGDISVDENGAPILDVEVIDADAALTAAIEKAGLTVTKEALSYYDIKLDKDNGIYEYDIEFIYDNIEYEADVNAATGEVIKVKSETNDKDDDDNLVIDENACIGKEAAEEKALAHVGLTREQVSNIRVKLDSDDGKAEYDVEFFVDGVEYEFEIDALDGTVISFEKDDIDEDENDIDDDDDDDDDDD